MIKVHALKVPFTCHLGLSTHRPGDATDSTISRQLSQPGDLYLPTT